MPSFFSWYSVKSSKSSSMVPSPPGRNTYAVRSSTRFRTPASTSATFLGERNLQNAARSGARYDLAAAFTVVPASRAMRMPPTGIPASIAPNVAASIIPGPPPVHVGEPNSSDTAFPSALADA